MISITLSTQSCYKAQMKTMLQDFPGVEMSVVMVMTTMENYKRYINKN